jgi:hypothetical protein
VHGVATRGDCPLPCLSAVSYFLLSSLPKQKRTVENDDDEQTADIQFVLLVLEAFVRLIGWWSSRKRNPLRQ